MKKLITILLLLSSWATFGQGGITLLAAGAGYSFSNNLFNGMVQARIALKTGTDTGSARALWNLFPSPALLDTGTLIVEDGYLFYFDGASWQTPATGSSGIPLSQMNDSLAQYVPFRDSTLQYVTPTQLGGYYNKTQSDARYLQTESDPIANAKTVQVANGLWITGGGAPQALSSNPSRTLSVDTAAAASYIRSTITAGSGTNLATASQTATGEYTHDWQDHNFNIHGISQMILADRKNRPFLVVDSTPPSYQRMIINISDTGINKNIDIGQSGTYQLLESSPSHMNVTGFNSDIAGFPQNGEYYVTIGSQRVIKADSNTGIYDFGADPAYMLTDLNEDTLCLKTNALNAIGVDASQNVKLFQVPSDGSPSAHGVLTIAGDGHVKQIPYSSLFTTVLPSAKVWVGNGVQMWPHR